MIAIAIPTGLWAQGSKMTLPTAKRQKCLPRRKRKTGVEATPALVSQRNVPSWNPLTVGLFLASLSEAAGSIEWEPRKQAFTGESPENDHMFCGENLEGPLIQQYLFCSFSFLDPLLAELPVQRRMARCLLCWREDILKIRTMVWNLPIPELAAETLRKETRELDSRPKHRSSQDQTRLWLGHATVSSPERMELPKTGGKASPFVSFEAPNSRSTIPCLRLTKETVTTESTKW